MRQNLRKHSNILSCNFTLVVCCSLNRNQHQQTFLIFFPSLTSNVGWMVSLRWNITMWRTSWNLHHETKASNAISETQAEETILMLKHNISFQMIIDMMPMGSIQKWFLWWSLYTYRMFHTWNSFALHQSVDRDVINQVVQLVSPFRCEKHCVNMFTADGMLCHRCPNNNLFEITFGSSNFWYGRCVDAHHKLTNNNNNEMHQTNYKIFIIYLSFEFFELQLALNEFQIC